MSNESNKDVDDGGQSKNKVWERILEREEEEDEHEKATRHLLFLLNKLTKYRLEVLTEHIVSTISNYRLLQYIVDLTFRKAIAEPLFASVYASLCKALSECLPEFYDWNQKKSFGVLLSTKCQTQFKEDFLYERSLKDLCGIAVTESESLMEESVQCLPLELIEFLEKKSWLSEQPAISVKTKRFGNVLFIYELYKIDFFDKDYIFSVLTCLQKQVLQGGGNWRSMMAVEALQVLYRSSTVSLNPKMNLVLHNNFELISEMANSKKNIPSRMCFLISDLRELDPLSRTIFSAWRPITSPNDNNDDNDNGTSNS